MNSDFILSILIHCNENNINKFILIIPVTKIISEYYCKLFCVRDMKKYNNGFKQSWIRKYIMRTNLIRLSKINDIYSEYKTYDFTLETSNTVYNYLTCSNKILLKGQPLSLYFSYINTIYVKLNYIPQGIFELINLRHLILNNANISIIPTEINNLINLTLLDLSSNNLFYAPKSYDVKKIIENHCMNCDMILQNRIKKINYNLQSFPIELCALNKLQKLNLSNNILFEIPQFIYNLNTLEYLHLKRNMIDMISTDIANLTHLRVLQLNNNIIKTIPTEILKLTNLYRLNLKHNNLYSIPREIFIKKVSKLLLLDVDNIITIQKI